MPTWFEVTIINFEIILKMAVKIILMEILLMLIVIKSIFIIFIEFDKYY